MLKQIEDMEKTESECTRLRADIFALNKVSCADKENLKKTKKEIIASNAKVDALELLVKDLKSAKKQLSRKYAEKIRSLSSKFKISHRATEQKTSVIQEHQMYSQNGELKTNESIVKQLRSENDRAMDEIDQMHQALTERRQIHPEQGEQVIFV